MKTGCPCVILRKLVEFGAQPAVAFGPSALKALRQRLVDEELGMSRHAVFIVSGYCLGKRIFPTSRLFAHNIVMSTEHGSLSPQSDKRLSADDTDFRR